MSTTYLVRLEARTRSETLAPGVAARMYDPAWMLGRQWQLGELLGEDAGSPVSVELQAETAMLACYRPGVHEKDVPYDPMLLPLEALVEAEPMRTLKVAWTARLRVDTGREFLRALRDAGLGLYAQRFREVFPLDRPKPAERASDPAKTRLLDVAAGRVPDGEYLYRSFMKAIADGELPAAPKVEAAHVDQVKTAAKAWLAWCNDTLLEADISAWLPDRLEHGFSVATGDQPRATTLDAEQYRGGRLDWHSFDCRPVAPPSGFSTLPSISVLPTGVRFRGMPNARWWEFEDASVDMGSVDAGASDSARLALLQFALVYGNDFFAVPLRLPVGSLTRINTLIIPDTFGMRLLIHPAARGTTRVGAKRWSMFTLSERTPGVPGGSGVSDVFFLPPIAGSVLASDTVEEVLLLRDEMANLAWAIERRYEGESGAAAERIEESIREQPEAPSPTSKTTLRYRLGTTVPAYWFPLVPVRIDNELRLTLRRMADQEASKASPRGRFLDLSGPPIHEEEVPREGTRLLRDYVLARWIGGSTLLWSRRRKRVGKGEGTSGLRFDITEQKRSETE